MTTVAVAARPGRASIVSAHGEILEQVTRQRGQVGLEVEQLRAAVQHAKELKWGTDALQRQLRRAEKRDLFLAKVQGALEAGFTVMPNLTLHVLAVRTEKNPSRNIERSQPEIGVQRLPAGKGEYVSPEPCFESWEDEIGSGDSKRTVTLYRTTEHAPVDVPFVLMQTGLAEQLADAMSLRLFDEIGLVQDGQGDPFLVGRVLHPKPVRYEHRGVAFFLGWWFDPRVLSA